MNTRMQDYRLLWRAALAHGNPFGSAVIRWGLLVVAPVLVAAQWHKFGLQTALAWLWCLVCVAVLAVWAWRFLPGAVQLNTPAHAALVPRMRRRLVELSCAVWFLAIAGIVLAPYTNRASLGGWLAFLVVLSAGHGLATAGHRAGMQLLVAAGVGVTLYGRLPPAVNEILSHPAALALALPVYLALMAAVAQEMFPQGGERHWDMLARRARIAARVGKRDALMEEASGGLASRWYAASLRRDSVARDSRRLVLHALGPVQHLGESVLALAVMSLVLCAVDVLTMVQTEREVLAGVGWIFAATMLAVPFAAVLRLSVLTGAHPGEGALLRLAPALPGAAPGFNRLLGRALALQALKGWAVASALALLLPALGGAGPATLARQAGICCLLLPLVVAPLRNHAVRAPNAALLALAPLLAALAASVALGFGASAAFGLPAMPVAAMASIACTALAFRHRLRVLERASFAFPAGRMD